MRGGYYTPIEMTDYIAQWAFSDGDKRNVLEPSCGDGAFLESLKSYANRFEECLAIELDSTEAQKASELVSDIENFNVVNNDFFQEFEWNLRGQRYDLILGNPPYIRYQYLTPEQRITQSNILVSNGMKSNKLINAWVSFLVACVELLDTNGKIALVIPAELLQVAYAAELRLFLSKNLSQVTIVTFRELVFPDVQQEVVILLGEKGENLEENIISVVDLQNLDHLNQDSINEAIEYKQIDHNKDKWTKYFLNNTQLEVISNITKHNLFKKFKEYASVDIGITTGNNKYFSVTNSLVEQYHLHKYALPLIGRSAHAKGLFFNEQDWLENVIDGLPAQLVHFPDVPEEELPSNLQDYVKYGETNNQHTGYKCSIRKNWYRIPSVWVPDAFFLRRNDTYPKFVLNEINAVSTDTMHRIKFKENVDHLKVLLAYYNSITLAFTEIEGRSYGGGVLEILPGEVENILLPNLENLDEETVNRLLNLIDRNIRERGRIEDILPEVDAVILNQHLGISNEIITSFRDIWRQLMNRRRQRA
nr:class I SAM-dependent methyltransferase [Mesobacillus harenae]